MMMIRFITLILMVVSCVLSHPVSQPVYPNNQYVSGQAIPAIQYKPRAQGYLQPQHAAAIALGHQQPARPVYEQPGTREGLQHYSTTQAKVGQPIQQVLFATNVDRQNAQHIQQPLYLHQIQSAQQQHTQAAQQALIAAAQRKAATQSVARPILVQQQPQIKYVSRPVQYQQQQPEAQEQLQQHQQEQESDPEDYDPNPTYQFGFDVKDDLYTNYQNRKEQREGNKITGSYSVVDSDGFVRTVTYTADPKEGFKAQVSRQPTDIVVKIPKPDPQYQRQPQQQQLQQHQPQQYIQAVPVQKVQQHRPAPQQRENVIYQYQ